jgi:hypothetical protein
VRWAAQVKKKAWESKRSSISDTVNVHCAYVCASVVPWIVCRVAWSWGEAWSEAGEARGALHDLMLFFTPKYLQCCLGLRWSMEWGRRWSKRGAIWPDAVVYTIICRVAWAWGEAW